MEMNASLKLIEAARLRSQALGRLRGGVAIRAILR
jgi:hypothetical protein